MIADKAALRAEIVATVERDLTTLERAHDAAREGATHEEAKPENDKDTRALEASYLARGQALRIEELRAALVQVRAVPVRSFGERDPIALGALVTIEDDDGGDPRFVYLAPYGGGAKLQDGRVQVVTPKSPLGAALLGKSAGDGAEIVLAGKARAITITAVA